MLKFSPIRIAPLPNRLGSNTVPHWEEEKKKKVSVLGTALELVSLKLTAKTSTLSRFRWASAKKRPSVLEPLQPLAHIADGFRQYIYNDIPTRLIDTSKFRFVQRNEVHEVFASEIAQITEEDVQRRMLAGVDTRPEAGIYVNSRKAALRVIIRDVVQYAIFSHRWTDSEPRFHDITHQGLNPRKQRNVKTSGFTKLVQLCETARALGYRLVWSDTCCIDKTDTAELSEAIHAMFKWHANAHVCIVHLAASSSLADFESEPWFRRGWTLQELLAPLRIKFYDQEWRPFTALANDKDDPALMAALSSVTGIPQEVIFADNTRGIKGHGIWEIMSWAALRKTTRIEDAAYCLFGLFNVGLPIMYGEGEKAFPRLVEALVARYPAWDVFAWAGQASERHPALPCVPACYPPWDAAMFGEEVGMTAFALTPHGLRLVSVPLIPMALYLVPEVNNREGLYAVMLRQHASAAPTLGMYSDITVICEPGGLQHIRAAVDLHVCILNYRPSRRSQRGRLQVGLTYVCFLLHVEGRNGEGPTWLKVETNKVLRITCKGMPARETSTERSSETEDGMFDLPLQTTYIRAPQA